MSANNNYILMDNFRGFSECVVPLSRTNFFVGENSSGKSSVLALIKIITEYTFWFKPDFKTEDINLGHSEDLISVNAEDRTFFRVGYLNNFKNASDSEEYLFNFGFLVTFVDRNGSPEPKNLTIQVNKNIVVHIRIDPNFLSYRIDENHSLAVENLQQANDLFSELIAIHKDGKGYKRISSQQIDKKNLQELSYQVLSAIRDKDNDKNQTYLRRSLFPTSRPIWLAPIRSKPKRTYDEPTNDYSSEGDHTPYLLSNLLGSKNKGANLFLEIIGRNTGLFKNVSVKKYGRNKNSPFELDIILDNKPLSIVNVGYGVSQSMPIIAELGSRPDKSWFIIQQPEVHLHPKAQAAIGDLLYESATAWKNICLIETHSDYMIDRFRLRLRKSEDDTKEAISDSQILFFCRKDGVNKVYPIEINNNGQLDTQQPDEYRDFFINEELDILGL